MTKNQPTSPNEIGLYKEITTLDMLLDDYVQKFSTNRRRDLGCQITDQCLILIKYCCLAWRVPDKRIEYLREFEAEYTVLDYLIRKCHHPSIKQLSDEQYLECAKIQANISRQLSGWIIKTRKNPDEE